ncbi:MAG: hypothetical protein E7050_04395 [Lentisphaerae bacterium]|nr:hypothetical protein [Lentisphaerota bacterium]
MNENEGHRVRLKKRFLQVGRSGLCEHEFLELLLFYAIPRKDTKPLAKELIRRFGSLEAVFAADIEQLMLTKGIGESAAILLKLIPGIGVELMSRSLREGICLVETDKLQNFLKINFRGCRSEELRLLLLDRNFRLLDVLNFPGGAGALKVSATDLIFKILCCRDVRNVIIAHNHPSGNFLPSRDDVINTVELKSLLAKIGISLLDHFIVSGENCCSIMKIGKNNY